MLDGYALNPGDLSWGALESMGSLEVYDRTAPGQVHERSLCALALLTNKTVLDRTTIEALPELRYIGVLATGTNIIDGAAARGRGVVVTNVPGYGADSVAEHTLSSMLAAAKHVVNHALAVRAGAWSVQPDFSFMVAPVRLLAGKTLGIIGFGAIGRRVAELAQAFKMKVLVARHGASASAAESGVIRCDEDELFRTADFVSLHCPLNAETHQLINARTLALMKRNAVLINTARGGLVDEAALASALSAGTIAAAHLDVLEVEPPRAFHPLARLPNCWITPHIAWASAEARGRLLEIATDNFRCFLDGTPVHVVN